MSDSLSRLVLRAQGRLPLAAPLLPSRYADAGPDAAWGEETSETTAATESPTQTLDLPVSQQRSTRQARDATPRTPELAATPQRLPVLPRPGTHNVVPPEITDQTRAVDPVASVQPSSDEPRDLIEAPREPAYAPRDLADAPRGSAKAPRNSATALRETVDAARNAGDALREIVAEGLPPTDRRPPDAVRRPPQPVLIEQMSEPSESVARDSVRATRSAPDLTAAASLLPARPAAASEVRISIGRVEVHAAPVPVPAATVPRPAPSRRPTVSLADYLAERSRAR